MHKIKEFFKDFFKDWRSYAKDLEYTLDMANIALQFADEELKRLTKKKSSKKR